MIPAVSYSMCGINSKNNVAFGQLKPQMRATKECKNPSFGISEKKLVGVLALGLIASVCATSKPAYNPINVAQMVEAKGICRLNKDTESVGCAASCIMAKHSYRFTDGNEVLKRVTSRCGSPLKQASTEIAQNFNLFFASASGIIKRR